jgi:hypothetical protein
MEGIINENLYKLPVEVVENICSFLNPFEFVSCQWSKKIFEKLPKLTRKSFLNTLHPYLLYLMKARDAINDGSKTFLFLAIMKPNDEFNNDYIFTLVKMGFPISLHHLGAVFRTLNFELMKYFHSVGIMKTIPLLFVSYCVEKGRIDILEWLLLVFPREIKFFTGALLTTSILNNQVEIAEFLFSQNPFMTRQGWLSSFRSHFENDLINRNMMEWLWNHNLRWTREEAEDIGNKTMLDFLS